MNYLYRCFDCGVEHYADYIEKNLIYICPKCGLAERNKPLKGVLEVEYNYELIKRKISSKKFLTSLAGDYRSYSVLLPIKSTVIKNSIKLNPTLQNIIFDNRQISVFNDTLNPTLSFKDRASFLVCLKAIELGITEISAASTGNAGSSLAGISAILGLKSKLFVPEKIPAPKRIQIQAYGAELYVVKGTYDDAFDLCMSVSDKMKWYNRNTAFNPMTIEGKKSAAFDIFILTKGNIPDSLFVPVGDGVIIAGLYKGFYDLHRVGLIEKIPKLIGVQSEGSNALVRYLKNNKYEFIKTNTIADSIDAAAPRNLYLATDVIKKTGGTAIAVKDDEIIEAQKMLSRKYGILCEPSSASVFAAYILMSVNDLDIYTNNAMLIVTGNGLKDFNSLTLWNKTPEIKTVAQWEKYFAEGNNAVNFT
ncbi:MAG: threonine synthase [Ignavibacteriae bacterium HGW-Ignavibacteriae-2]|nr:MAG: threonine synthase [Ignavibacteriae bacterium HGW-Ignavibacteriae-2]